MYILLYSLTSCNFIMNNKFLLIFYYFKHIGSITQGTPNILNHQIPAPLDLRTNNKINPQPTIVVEDKILSKYQ